jgi:hypothetical protein
MIAFAAYLGKEKKNLNLIFDFPLQSVLRLPFSPAQASIFILFMWYHVGILYFKINELETISIGHMGHTYSKSRGGTYGGRHTDAAADTVTLSMSSRNWQAVRSSYLSTSLSCACRRFPLFKETSGQCI